MSKIKISGEFENLVETIEEIQKFIGFRLENKIRIIASDDNYVIYESDNKLAIMFFNVADKISSKHFCTIQGIL